MTQRVGYDEGSDDGFTVDPPLPPEKVKVVQAFCESVHTPRRDGPPSEACPWTVDDNGTLIVLGGGYGEQFDTWLTYLLDTFFDGHTVTGEVLLYAEYEGALRITVTDGHIETDSDYDDQGRPW